MPSEALSADGGRYRRSRRRAARPCPAGPASMVLPRPTSSAISKLVRGIDRARTTGSSWYSSISMPGRNGACSDVLGAPGDPGGVAGGDAARAHVRHHPLPVTDGHELPGLGDGARFLGLHVCGSALCGVALGGVADVARGQALGVHRQPSSFLAPVIPGAGVSPRCYQKSEWSPAAPVGHVPVHGVTPCPDRKPQAAVPASLPTPRTRPWETETLSRHRPGRP